MTIGILIAISLLSAGFVKGLFGMGLPTVSIGLLSLWLAPVEAATLLVIPTFATNAWQFVTGRAPLAVARRFGTLLIGVALGTAIGIGFLTGIRTDAVSFALGIVLLLYAVVGLFGSHITVAPSTEKRLSPLIGLATGIVNGATGVSVMPLVPFLNSLRLEADDLVQALGLVFLVAILALASCLAWTGHLHVATAGSSVLACVPAFAGVYAGQIVRQRLHANAYRKWFFTGLFALGAYSAIRAIVRWAS